MSDKTAMRREHPQPQRSAEKRSGSARIEITVAEGRKTRRWKASVRLPGSGRAGTPPGLPSRTIQVFASLAHPERIEVLLCLFGGVATHRALADRTGLKAGPLYHHLNRLRMTGLVSVAGRNAYELTPRGRQAILVASAFGRLRAAG